jgi:hypothetical protein
LRLEDLLRNREFLMKMIMLGFLASLVFIAIGIIVVFSDILG